MKIEIISEARRDEWDTFVAQQSFFSLLQSWEWGEFKEKLGWMVYRIAAEKQNQVTACAQLLIKTLPGGLASIGYIPRGPLCDWSDQGAVSSLLSELHRIARLHKVSFLKIEPPLYLSEIVDQQIRQNGFRLSRYTNQPRTTIIVDISPSEEEILLHMRKKTRQYIHSAIREGITVRMGSQEDLPAYYNLMRLTGQREHFPARLQHYYEQDWQILSQDNHCILLMAFYEDQLLAVRTAYRFGKHAAEFHAGSINHKSNLHPNYLLVWEAMRWAKSQGCDTYDLWGIPDEIGTIFFKGTEPPIVDRSDGLWGVYRFKSGFSKNIVSYVGAYDYVYQPHLYRLISNRFISGETLDRIMAWMDSIKRK
jgi:lipid II:glycine glycyltransferase (peptidoglycan interpeptide bridge formation enzyme)